MHVHAFSPMEILNGATKLGVSFEEFLAEAKRHGLGTIPGTAAEILDDDVRWVLTKGKLPADTWEQIVRTAHGLGIRSSSTIMFGHVDAPPHWVAHIRRIARIQADTGGFTEFVPLPFVHQHAPIYLSGKARAGATFEENLRMHAVARILLDGSIDEHPGVVGEARRRRVQAILRSGANDFGGTLMEETISRMAGAEWGIEMTPDQFDDAIHAIGRTPAVRTTTYDRVDPTATSGIDESRRAPDGHTTTSHRLATSLAGSTRWSGKTRDEAGNFLEVGLVTGAVLPSESHCCDFGGRRACITTSLGKNERGVANTILRSSSPRREAHRGRPSGSAASVPSASSASTTRSVVMSDTACGEA